MSPSTQELRQAVLRTLVYAQVFDGTLTQATLRRWLLSGRSWSSSEWQEVCSSLRTSGLWKKTMRPTSLTTQGRDGQEELAAAQALSWIPWIQSIWLTGRRAATGESKDDIDLLFIVDEDRLWISRALVVATALWHGRYRARKHGQDPRLVQGRWCCNIWLTPSQVAGFSVAPSTYVAREVVQARPLFRRADSDLTLFLHQNRWVRQWVASGWQQSLRQAQRFSASLGWFAWMRHPWLNGLWTAVEWCAWQLQYWYLHRHQTRELVGWSRALFHPRDTQSWVRERYATIAQEYGMAFRLDE